MGGSTIAVGGGLANTAVVLFRGSDCVGGLRADRRRLDSEQLEHVQRRGARRRVAGEQPIDERDGLLGRICDAGRERRRILVGAAETDGQPVVAFERCPAREQSKSRQPKAYMSVALPLSRPRACSGDQYSGVPSSIPCVVTLVEERASLASPKSETTTRPLARSIRTLAGVRSRWTIPLPWA